MPLPQHAPPAHTALPYTAAAICDPSAALHGAIAVLRRVFSAKMELARCKLQRAKRKLPPAEHSPDMLDLLRALDGYEEAEKLLSQAQQAGSSSLNEAPLVQVRAAQKAGIHGHWEFDLGHAGVLNRRGSSGRQVGVSLKTLPPPPLMPPLLPPRCCQRRSVPAVCGRFHAKQQLTNIPLIPPFSSRALCGSWRRQPCR